MVGNDSRVDQTYLQSVEMRQDAPETGAFRGGALTGVQYARFGQGYDSVSSYEQGADGGRYTVQAGDTLAGIALKLWGDSSLWYKLAQANGLSGDSVLIEGRTLSVPGGVIRNANNASTFKPYDPAAAYGDTSPTTPKPIPPKVSEHQKNKCGVFGQILLVVIAVAVTIWASPAAPTFWEGVIAGAAGSAASQAVGLATGIQDKIDFKGFALSALSGGIGAELRGVTAFGGNGGLAKFGSAVVRGALGSALTQGIGVATGLQSKFDWAGVAAAGIGGGISSGLQGGFTKGGSSFSFGEQLLTNAASGIANAATRSVVNGTDFGDNVMATLPDVIGSTIGGLVASKVASIGATGRAASASVDRLKQAVFGDGKLSTDQAAALAEVRDAVKYAAIHPDDKAARSAADAAVSGFLDSNGDSTAVADFRQSLVNGNTTASAQDDIVVTGHRNYWAGHTIDGAGIWVGEKARDIKAATGEFISAHPGVGVALSVANIGLTIAGGPTRFVAGLALDRFKSNVSGWLSDQLQASDWNVEKSQAGGEGFVLAGEILLSGATALTGIALYVGRAAESATAQAARLGREGERAVGLLGPKVGVRIPGSNQLRFPDNLTSTTLSEVKNVGSQGLTRQLRDYVTYSQSKALNFDLYVRGPLHPQGQTYLTKPLADAVRAGNINLKFIPGTH